LFHVHLLTERHDKAGNLGALCSRTSGGNAPSSHTHFRKRGLHLRWEIENSDLEEDWGLKGQHSLLLTNLKCDSKASLTPGLAAKFSIAFKSKINCCCLEKKLMKIVNEKYNLSSLSKALESCYITVVNADV